MRKAKTAVLVACVAWSVVNLAFSPLGHVFHQLESRGLLILIALIATEVLFVTGVGISAVALGMRVGNPKDLRSRWKAVLSSTDHSVLFWVGFYVNMAGAIGTGVAGLVGVLLVLPTTSWPLAAVFLFDIYATLAVRRAIRGASRRHRTP